MLHILSSANITRCHFSSNWASGDGGAIYVATKSELRAFDSQFKLNVATHGGSIAVRISDSLIESCGFSSNTASLSGGCMSFEAANVTVQRSNLSDAEVEMEDQCRCHPAPHNLRL